jgi:hypothetical protein
MIEIECPTCENRIKVSRKLSVWDKIECPLCGEKLQVVSVNPLVVEYYEEDEQDEESCCEEDVEYKNAYQIDDEENEIFELPEKSTLFENPEDEEDETEDSEEEAEDE